MGDAYTTQTLCRNAITVFENLCKAFMGQISLPSLSRAR
jgi:hypothetical protein